MASFCRVRQEQPHCEAAILLKSLGSHSQELFSLLFHSLKAVECSMTVLEN